MNNQAMPYTASEKNKIDLERKNEEGIRLSDNEEDDKQKELERRQFAIAKQQNMVENMTDGNNNEQSPYGQQ